MTYDASEKSIFGAKPVELYEFIYTDRKQWRFTSAATEQQAYDTANVYTPAAIGRSKLIEDGEINKKNLQVFMPSDNEMTMAFIEYPPVEQVFLNVYRQHVTDVDTETVLLWKGRVVNWERTNSQATLHCESIATSILRPGLRRFYSSQCPHRLYGTQCGVIKTAFEVETTVDSLSVDGLQVSIAAMGAQVDHYYSGGTLEYFDDEGLLAKRALRDHTATVATMAARVKGLEAGSVVKIYPGCPRILTTCAEKFSNEINFGGTPFIPFINPFDAATLY